MSSCKNGVDCSEELFNAATLILSGLRDCAERGSTVGEMRSELDTQWGQQAANWHGWTVTCRCSGNVVMARQLELKGEA